MLGAVVPILQARENDGEMRRPRPLGVWSLMGVGLTVAVLGCSGDSQDGDVCAPDDQDGIVGITATFAVSVSDAAFAPAIIKTQNKSTITLTVTNAGTAPHGFAIDCLSTPNDRGCPATSCFTDAATLAPIAPGASATITFPTPGVEGIYTFRSNGPGDTQTGQFILQ
jgi:hypothetical protein